MKPSFFLGPRPGELLYSALARHSDALGGFGPKATMLALFGRSNAIATMDLPNNLGALLSRLSGDMGLTVDGLALNHTLFPYYTRYQSTQIAGRALSAMAQAGGSIHLMLGLPTFRTVRPSHLQFCLDCFRLDAEGYGSPHWRTAHQLPGVLVCPEHGRALQKSTVDLATCNRHEFFAASEDRCAPGCEPVSPMLADDMVERALAIAHASAALLDVEDGITHGDGGLAGYREALRSIGLMKGEHKANQRELKLRFEDHWGHLLTMIDGLDLPDEGETWLASLVRTAQGAQPPLQHLMLQLFLDAQPPVAARPQRKYVQRLRQAKRNRIKPTAVPRVDWRRVDAEYSDALRRGAARIYRSSPPARVTLAAVERLLRRRDWLAKRRGKLPLSCAAARSIHEPVAAFQIRRLRWHAERCRGEGVDDPWVLLRRAGLKGGMIADARRELTELPLPDQLRAAA